MASLTGDGSHLHTILVIEDNRIVRDFLIKALKRSGYTVLPANDGQDAGAALQTHGTELALILADIALPKISGPEFVNSIPPRATRIPVIFMTGLGEYQVEASVREKFLVLYKPFTLKELLHSIKLAVALNSLPFPKAERSCYPYTRGH
jgi:two-component system cell cycle sensor histidine kinase/response regulator CckA